MRREYTTVAEANETLRDTYRRAPGETFDVRYEIYLSCADMGDGRDSSTDGKTMLKTFEEWMCDRPGRPAPGFE